MSAQIRELSPGVHLVGSGGWGITEPISQRGDSNVYLVDCGGPLALVDTGVGPIAADILDNVRAAGFAPEMISAIFLTHAHGDHSGSAAWIRGVTGATIYSGAVTARALALPEPRLIGGMEPFVPFEPQAFTVDHWLLDVDDVTVGDIAFKAFFTPGHTVDAFCFLAFVAGKRILFSGDTVIGNQVRPDIAGQKVIKGMLGWLDGHWSAPLTTYQASLKRLLEVAPDIMLPGHGVHHDAAQSVDAISSGISNIQRVLDDPDIYVMFSVSR